MQSPLSRLLRNGGAAKGAGVFVRIVFFSFFMPCGLDMTLQHSHYIPQDPTQLSQLLKVLSRDLGLGVRKWAGVRRQVPGRS